MSLLLIKFIISCRFAFLFPKHLATVRYVFAFIVEIVTSSSLSMRSRVSWPAGLRCAANNSIHLNEFHKFNIYFHTFVQILRVNKHLANSLVWLPFFNCHRVAFLFFHTVHLVVHSHTLAGPTSQSKRNRRFQSNPIQNAIRNHFSHRVYRHFENICSKIIFDFRVACLRPFIIYKIFSRLV